MKKTLVLLISAGLMMGFAACKKSGSGGEGASGDGCEGIGAMEARMKCENNAVMFCSSFTSYKWQQQNACAEGTNCYIAEDGKSGGCR
ncbi:MAG: hypothetical protein K1X75_13560 [Leptospirales bacterium]|nr:hypothetical protein [Leptospirales bacterium]